MKKPIKVKIPNYGTLYRLSIDPSKKVVVFDMDETLIHTNSAQNFKISEKFTKVKRKGQASITIGFTIRPYLYEMLEQLKPHYNLVIMTSSAECYAKAIFEILDPKKEFF